MRASEAGTAGRTIGPCHARRPTPRSSAPSVPSTRTTRSGWTVRALPLERCPPSAPLPLRDARGHARPLVQPAGAGPPAHRAAPRYRAPRCPTCERAYARHEGVTTGRGFVFGHGEIARVLLRVGEGMSLREASRDLRESVLRRRRAGPEPGAGHEPAGEPRGRLPRRLRPGGHRRAPPDELASGSVVLDSVPLLTRGYRADASRPTDEDETRVGNLKAGTILVALDGTARGARPCLMRVAGAKDAESWKDLLRHARGLARPRRRRPRPGHRPRGARGLAGHRPAALAPPPRGPHARSGHRRRRARAGPGRRPRPLERPLPWTGERVRRWTSHPLHAAMLGALRGPGRVERLPRARRAPRATRPARAARLDRDQRAAHPRVTGRSRRVIAACPARPGPSRAPSASGSRRCAVGPVAGRTPAGSTSSWGSSRCAPGARPARPATRGSSVPPSRPAATAPTPRPRTGDGLVADLAGPRRALPATARARGRPALAQACRGRPCRPGPRAPRPTLCRRERPARPAGAAHAAVGSAAASRSPRPAASVRGRHLADYPDLLLEWAPDANADLDPATLAAGSHVRVVWRCLLEPAHVWETKVADRTYRRSGCPFHMGNRVHPAESLAAYFPWLALRVASDAQRAAPGPGHPGLGARGGLALRARPRVVGRGLPAHALGERLSRVLPPRGGGTLAGRQAANTGSASTRRLTRPSSCTHRRPRAIGRQCRPG